MLLPLCPACRYPNPANASRCVACGAALPASALWLDQLGQPTAQPPAPATPPAPPLTLRDVQPPPREAPPPAPAPKLDGLLVSDPEPAEIAEAAAQLASRRAAKRAAVRRARTRASADVQPDSVPEVLIVDADNLARGRLRDLLVAFGFGVHAVAGVVQATALLVQRPFVAGFFDVALDDAADDAGIALCQQARQLPMLRVLVSAPLSPVQRVRAALAGFDEMLAKPVNRGDVARVFDARGIALPSDARRG